MRKMENVLDIALYLYKQYEIKMHKGIDEMKLHKLLYFSQRESLVRTNQPLFKEEFEGWKYGPVCILIREAFKNKIFDTEESFDNIAEKLSKESCNIIQVVLETYGHKESWSLSDITHEEYSWRKSREGLKDGENGNQIILLDDIRVDAERISKRRNKLSKMKSNERPVNTASYLPIITEEDILSYTEGTIDVAEKIRKIQDKIEKRRNSHERWG